MDEGQNIVSSSPPTTTNSTNSLNDSNNLIVISGHSQIRARRSSSRGNSSVNSSDDTPHFVSRIYQSNTNNSTQDVDELNASAATASTTSSLSSSPSVQSSVSSTSSSTANTKSLSPNEREIADGECNDDIYFEAKEECDSCSFVPVSVQTLDINDFECSLCYKLFYQPVTTVCGHTYCKSCLMSSLQYSPHCPLCRHKLFDHPQDFNYSINFVLANVIEKNFPWEYKQREEEEKQLQLKMCVQEQMKAGNNDLNSERRRSSQGGTWWGCVLLYPCDM
jgi:hypothetical protein